jgi:hypothetical protein
VVPGKNVAMARWSCWLIEIPATPPRRRRSATSMVAAHAAHVIPRTCATTRWKPSLVCGTAAPSGGTLTHAAVTATSIEATAR